MRSTLVSRSLSISSLERRRRRWRAPTAAPLSSDTTKEPSTRQQLPRTLTAAHLADTATILNPRYLYLSPCFGASLSTCTGRTSVISNLMKLGDFLKECYPDDEQKQQRSSIHAPSRLARRLFFQPHEGALVRLTRNKSVPAAHLTAARMGALQGLAFLNLNLDHKQGDKRIKELLKTECHIQSNYVGGEWTGVSLARWKELIRCLSPSSSIGDNYTNSLGSSLLLQHKELNLLSSAVWNVALWHTSTSKRCLLEYLLALERVSGLEILCPNDEYATALKHDETVQHEWAQKTLTGDDLGNPESVKISLERLLLLLRHKGVGGGSINTSNIGHSFHQQTARDLEIACAAIAAREHTAKPVVPNGYYAYDGGKLKPDCVEVAVRELMDLLLWNEQTASFDVERLPPTARPELISLYHRQDKQQHEQQQRRQSSANEKDIREKINPFSRDRETTAAAAVEEEGKKWFEMLSNIDGCDYLSTSPNGIPYELKPTLKNMTKVFQWLLYPTTMEKEEWTSLEDLANAYKSSKLQIKLGTLSVRAQMSHELHIWETAQLSLEGNVNAIDMRLRCDWARNTGFATVSHLRLLQKKDMMQSLLLDQEHKLLKALSGALQQHRKSSLSRESGDDSAWLYLLALSSVGDCALKNLPSNSRTIDMDSLLVYLLSAPHGVDRQKLMDLAATTDLEREERAYEKEFRESKSILTAALRQTCHAIQNSTCAGEVELGMELLGWALAETPTTLANKHCSQQYDTNTERSILNLLPTNRLVENPPIQCGLARNAWACRGKLLQNWMLLKTGRTSLLETLADLGPRNFISLLWLLGRVRAPRAAAATG